MVKEKIKNLLDILKKSIKRFPITTISIYLITAIYAICIGNNWVDWDVIIRITTFTSIFAITTFLIETLATSKKSKIIYYILAIIWSAISTISVYTKSDVLGLSNELFIHFVGRVISCYVISIIILSLYYNFKKSEKDFGEYLTGIVINTFKTSIIYGILAIGLSIVTSIFIFLILNGRGYILLARIEILLLGMYYVPTTMYSFYNQEGKPGKFAKVVIKYVLGTLVMSAFAIIYIYILKIFILRNIPSNQIFRILASLFVIGLPIWTMCSSFNEGKTFDKINDKMPLLFIPFIFLQMYSIGVRIGENGITEARYLCVMLIIFEIIYTIIYIKNRSNIAINLLVIVAFTVISTIAPFVNMFKISVTSQYSILKTYKQKENLLTNEEKNKMYGAYRYLKSSVIGKEYLEIEGYILENEADKNYYSNDDEVEIYASIYLEYIPIEGYKKLYKINAYEYLNNEDLNIEEAFKNVEFKVDNSSKTFNVNIENKIKEYIKLGDSLDKKFNNINEIIVDNNKKIILNYIRIEYDKTTNEIDSYSINGYLLEK